MPRSNFEAYSGTPLPKKLGIKEGSTVFLIDAPQDFDETLGELPEGAALCTQPDSHCRLAIWFTKSREELEGRMEETLRSLAGKRRPLDSLAEKASKVASDLDQNVVREIGLAAGLVDYKVCSIDRTWSGLLFTRRHSG